MISLILVTLCINTDFNTNNIYSMGITTRQNCKIQDNTG